MHSESVLTVSKDDLLRKRGAAETSQRKRSGRRSARFNEGFVRCSER